VRLTPPRRGTHDDARPWVTPGCDTNLSSLRAYPQERAEGCRTTPFTNFSTGRSHSFGGEYLELVPHERIRYTDRFDDPNLPGEMQTTITLKKVSCGTELNIVQEGLPAVIPPEACHLGWQESLTLLAKLVEAEIPD